MQILLLYQILYHCAYYFEIIKNIKRKAESIIERCVSDDEDSEYAETVFETIKELNGYSLIKCILKTGRTHQIRAHFAHIGHPLVGDGKYGINEINKKFNKKTQELTAYKLIFNFKTDSSILEYLNHKQFEIS